MTGLIIATHGNLAEEFLQAERDLGRLAAIVDRDQPAQRRAIVGRRDPVQRGAAVMADEG